MLKRIRQRLGGLSSDQSGVSIIEFAAVAPLLGLMIVGVADLGRGYGQRFALQQAANRTMELAHLGTREDDYSFLEAEAESAAGTGADAVLTQWTECINASNTREAKPFRGTCSTSQQTARYVTLELVRTFTPMFTSAGYPKETDGTIKLKARTTLRVQ